MLRTSSVLLVVLLLFGKKTKRKPLNLSKLITETTRVKIETCEKLNEALLKSLTSMRGSNIPINGPTLPEKAHEFAKAFKLLRFYSIERMIERLEGKVNDIFLEFKPK